MDNAGLIVGLVAIAIALIALGILFAAYLNVSSDIRRLEKSVSDLETEIRDLKLAMVEANSRDIQRDEEIASLSQMNNDLRANLTLLEGRINLQSNLINELQSETEDLKQRVSLLEQRVDILENGQVPTGTASAVAQWTFDDMQNLGNDSSGNGNELDFLGGLKAADDNSVCKAGGCLNFDGIDDYASVERSASLEPSRAITISAWIYARDSFSSSLVNKASTSHVYPFYSYDLQITQAPDQPTKAQAWFDLTTNGQYQYIGGQSTGAVIDLHTWQFITAVYDETHMKLYINGELKGSAPKTGAITYYDIPLVLGRYSNLEGIGLFDGYLDEVRIYDRALGNSEIVQLYNNIS